MTDAAKHIASSVQAGKRPLRRAAKPRPSILEKLTLDELQSLRLDEDSRGEFDAFMERFKRCRAALEAFEGKDVASMDDALYDQHSVAEAERHGSGMAVVHFMAPHILRLRDGAAKRKWRSFLTKFRKGERL
ncbi:hypothetical protein CK218_24205 [Mesorhizobium sp. WSM3879]|uniref:hypothetical protein n=1 Tax=Mesorhizobium sp. WSM3879 TaxID=2029406 RepID=UPI000BAF2C22|nr:hypothetical protein [Mesorhizobium sp. WSM3879]PBB78467.1 hypothetical protein CK218_24205 [Mesorhizobium sp. WSM3879]